MKLFYALMKCALQKSAALPLQTEKRVTLHYNTANDETALAKNLTVLLIK